MVIYLERGAGCLQWSDATAIPKTPSYLASFKSRLVLPFWYRLTQVVLKKRPLNRAVVPYLLLLFVLMCC